MNGLVSGLSQLLRFNIQLLVMGQFHFFNCSGWVPQPTLLWKRNGFAINEGQAGEPGHYTLFKLTHYTHVLFS